MKPYLLTLSAMTLLAFACGCNQSGNADDHEDDHHAEHFVPPHKPANYAQAVEEIEHRAAHLTSHAGHGHDDEAEEFHELVDIVEWLPELAADSDLNEADWGSARAAGQSIASELNSRMKEDGSLTLDKLDESIQSSVATLQSLVAAAGIPEPEIDHHDHHEDEDHHDHTDGE